MFNVTSTSVNEEMKAAIMPVTVFIGTEAVCGFVGNVLILYIYVKRYPKCNFRCFVVCMAAVDLTSCLTTLPGEVFSQFHWYDFTYPAICKFKCFFNMFTVWGSGLTLLLIAVDRYRKVCKPLSSQMQSPMATKLCFAAICLSAILASPVLELWGTYTYSVEIEDTMVEVSICERSNKYVDSPFPFIYVCFVYIVPVCLLMLLAIVLNTFVVKHVFWDLRRTVNVSNEKFPLRQKASVTKVRMKFKASTSSRSSDNNSAKASDTKNSVLMVTRDNLLTNQDGKVISLIIPRGCYEVDEGDHSCRNSEKRHDFVNLCQCKNVENRGGKKSLGHWIGARFSRTDQSTEEPKQESSSTKRLRGHLHRERSVGNGTSPACNDPLTGRRFQSRTKPEDCDREGEVSLGNHARNNESDKSTLNSKEDIVLERNVSFRSNTNSENLYIRLKNKTLIMLILTSLYVVTTLLYLSLVSLISGMRAFHQSYSNNEKVAIFFFWRLYFMNCIINPVLYGFLDPRFRGGLKNILRKCICGRCDR